MNTELYGQLMQASAGMTYGGNPLWPFLGTMGPNTVARLRQVCENDSGVEVPMAQMLYSPPLDELPGRLAGVVSDFKAYKFDYGDYLEYYIVGTANDGTLAGFKVRA